jgi:peptidoglycan/xylan/chitin deacetylase (PgdA/CDA1 family)
MFSRLSRYAARHLACNWLPLNRERGVVSFSFDDAPRSACIEGKQILEKYFARGTFYLCGGLMDRSEQGRPCHTHEDVQRLVADGHEVACHTYSHLNCAGRSADVLQHEWEQNRQFLESFGAPAKGFAFPFGAYDLTSKLAASNRFAYSRITSGGMQTGRADLNALRAQALYANSISEQQIQQLVKATAESGGWLIFYSHEVDRQHSRWGTSPEQLAFALHTAQEYRCRVLPVRDAIQFFKSGK